MTRPSQKRRERFLTEQAIKSLGADWIILEECEPPDFIIAAGERRFGLDVSEVFAGPASRSGSATRRAQSDTQKTLNAYRLEYEAATGGILLQVKFVGSITQETMARLVSDLIELDLASKPVGHRAVVDSKLGLRVHVTKHLRSEWYSLNDRVGWVDRNPQKIIADAIEAKGKKLQRYQAAAGTDIRLLLVADAIHNSGKMRLQEGHAFDLHGFEAVYLFLYPEGVIALNNVLVL